MPKRISRLHKDLRAIGEAIKALAHHFEQLAPLLGEGAMDMANVAGETKSRRRRPRLTAQHRAALKFQGRYIGTLRGLKPAQRAKVKKIRAAKGYVAAIKAAAKLAGSAS